MYLFVSRHPASDEYTGANCLASLTAFTSQGSGQVDLFDPYCNYLGDATYNAMILNGACGVLTGIGCCYESLVRTSLSYVLVMNPCQ